MTSIDIFAALNAAAAKRIIIIDGAMGTMIQSHALDEAGYRGERLAKHPHDLRGNNDILNLTNPAIIAGIHDEFLAAGVDIIETNTFNATSIAQADYGTEALAYEINRVGSVLAREATARAMARDPAHRRFVAGAIGPTNKTASISPDVTNPGYRNVTFDGLVAAYADATRGLLDGGAELLLVETIFDTLNAKAALFAISTVLEERAIQVPLMISGTITDLSGRTLSGQTTEAFWISVGHAQPWSVGLNCAFGAREMRPYVAELSRVADTLVSAYPNAGLPNEFGAYDDTPESMANQLAEWARAGLLNLVGGCCGTTPRHIKAIAEAVRDIAPRPVPAFVPALRLAGLEPFVLAS